MADDDQVDNNVDYEDDDDSRICKVYDKQDFFTVFVQILLAVIALGSLWFKRLREHPKRKFVTWFLDISKQAIGASYAHVMNMVIAAIIAQHPERELADQCAWYGLSYLIDTTLGLVLAIVFIGMLDRVANDRNWTSLKHSGVYTGETAMVHWIHQVSAWLVILTIVKIIIYFFMILAAKPLAYVGRILFRPFQGNIRFELMFVMIIFPGFLNIIYFWIADSYLKAKDDQTEAHEKEQEDGKKSSLLTDEEKQKEQELQNAKPNWTSL